MREMPAHSAGARPARQVTAGNGASQYAGARAVLATMHGKERAIADVLSDRLGLSVTTRPQIDTDALGTFTGETPRAGTMRQAAIAKARLGMAAAGLPLGIASEGSYGPHPHIPFVAGGIELMVLVDDDRNIVVSEFLVDDAPAYHHVYARSIDDIGKFLGRAGFPAHALIVKAAAADPTSGPIYKGLRGRADLESAIAQCAGCSGDGRAFIQSDMRAHMNPTRMKTLRRLAQDFAARVAMTCPACGTPGYGKVDVETGLPCEDCAAPSIMVRNVVFGCVACPHREPRPRPDGRRYADPVLCPHCNP